MRFGHLELDEIGKFVHDPFWKGCSVVAPTPDGHAADSKEFCRRCVAAEDYFKHEIMPAAGQSRFEARSGYWFGTRWHDVRLAWLCGPLWWNFKFGAVLSMHPYESYAQSHLCGRLGGALLRSAELPVGPIGLKGVIGVIGPIGPIGLSQGGNGRAVGLMGPISPMPHTIRRQILCECVGRGSPVPSGRLAR
jgi:hypothetical protein